MITKRTTPVYTTSDGLEYTSLAAAQEQEIYLAFKDVPQTQENQVVVPVKALVARADAVIDILRTGPRSRKFTNGKKSGRPKGSKNKPKVATPKQPAEPDATNDKP